MIRFLYPSAFWFLLLPFAIFWILPRVQGLHGSALRIPFLDDLKKIKSKAEKLHIPMISQRTLFSLKFFYLLAIWCCLVVALARPQYAGEPYHLKAENRDIMLVVDISTSMLRHDFYTDNRGFGKQNLSRLAAVKAVVSAFIEKRTEDRIGLILFGTLAYLQAPLTFDKQSVKEILMNTDAGMAGDSTSIGDALGIALKSLKDENKKDNKIIILLTDGENNDGSLSMEQAIDLAEKEGIKVYTIGIGKRSRAFLRSRNNKSGESDLEELSRKTDGDFFRANDLSSLAQVYQQIDALEPQTNEGSIVQEIKEYFYIPLLIALSLVLLFLFLPRSYFK